jgi:hypothetical protein
MLLSRLEPDFKVEHGEFAWSADGSLSMKFRISIERSPRRGEIWEIGFSYPAGEATAVHPDATSEERDWFTMMVRTHIVEWREGGPTVITDARRRK